MLHLAVADRPRLVPRVFTASCPAFFFLFDACINIYSSVFSESVLESNSSPKRPPNSKVIKIKISREVFQVESSPLGILFRYKNKSKLTLSL